MDTPGVETLRTALSPLCGELHDVFATGVGITRDFRNRHDLLEGAYGSLAADITRGIVHRELKKRDGIGGWRIGGNHKLRGQLMLTSGLMRVRFLHQQVGVIPPAGRNHARRAYYRNVPFGQVVGFDAESSNLLAVWQVEDPEFDGVSIRIVRPISDKARSRVSETPVDVDFILPGVVGELSSLEFEQVDDGLTLDLSFTEDEFKDDGSDDAASDFG